MFSGLMDARHNSSISNRLASGSRSIMRSSTVPAEQQPAVVDQWADRAWKALRMRLEAATLLHPSHEEAAEAQAVLDRLFGDDGTEFLKLGYPAQLTAMNVHMVPIDGEGDDATNQEPGLAERIGELVGTIYLENVRDRIVAYHKMVAAMATQTAVPAAQRPHLRVMQEAIVHYATIVIANVKRNDEASLVRARALLAPIDNARAKAVEGLKATRKANAKTKAAKAKTPPVVVVAERPGTAPVGAPVTTVAAPAVPVAPVVAHRDDA